MKIQSMLADELGAVLHLLLLAAGLQSTNSPFPVGKGFSLVFPLLASGLGVILVRKLHSTSGLSDFLACSENCVKNVRGWVPLYSFWLPMGSSHVSPLMVTVLPASTVQYRLSSLVLCADT